MYIRTTPKNVTGKGLQKSTVLTKTGSLYVYVNNNSQLYSLVMKFISLPHRRVATCL